MCGDDAYCTFSQIMTYTAPGGGWWGGGGGDDAYCTFRQSNTEKSRNTACIASPFPSSSSSPPSSSSSSSKILVGRSHPYLDRPRVLGIVCVFSLFPDIFCL